MFSVSLPQLLRRTSPLLLHEGRRRRLHGTVTAFKHRRGYGFVLAEGAVPASPTDNVDETSAAVKKRAQQFFFTRVALQGGYYITEGERVSFTPIPVKAGKGIRAKLSGTEEGSSQVALLEQATRMNIYNSRTGAENDVLPISLSGLLVRWDAIRGDGTIAELDINGRYHADGAPTYDVTLEDMDLTPGYDVREGLLVKFCEAEAVSAEEATDATPAQRPRAQRVIVDIGAIRKQKAGSRFTEGLPHAAPLSPPSTSPRANGTVREVVSGRYGFIVDDATGASVFFHMEHTIGDIREGDRVSYRSDMVTLGRHKGKVRCVDVKRTSFSDDGTSGAQRSAGVDDDDDDDFDLLD